MNNTVIDTDYALLNALNVILSHDKTQYMSDLISKGYLDEEAQIDLNQINILSGVFTYDLFNAIYDYFEIFEDKNKRIFAIFHNLNTLYDQNNHEALYMYFVLIHGMCDLDLSGDIQMLSAHKEAFRNYIFEVIQDFIELLCEYEIIEEDINAELNIKKYKLIE